MNKEMKELREKVESCQKCDLYKDTNNAVFGEGDDNADILLIGEAPGYWEDKKGRPFVGKAGKFLDEMLEAFSMKREDIYIANILKHRPPKNRDPTTEEIEACTPYLDKQIELINPEIIVTLGNFATKYILRKYNLQDKIKGISKLHGKVFYVTNLLNKIKIIPIYHPAVAVYNANMKDTLKKDFKIVKENME